MTLRIERTVSRKTEIARLIGRMNVEQLKEVPTQIELAEVPVTLDLSKLSLVSVERVRFLNAGEVAKASPFVSAWMLRERETNSIHDGHCNSFGLAWGSGPGEPRV
jgi:hypothetical protein